MDIQAYISGGNIESYVLGLASPEERAEFERMCAAYPELAAARNAFEIQLEQNMLKQAVAPPDQLREMILSKIRSDLSGSKAKSVKPALPPPVAKLKWMPYLAAASVILLIGSVLLNVYYFTRYKEYSGKYTALLQSSSGVTETNQVLNRQLQQYEQSLNIIRDTSMAVIKMPGTPTSPQPGSIATVYWDKRTKDVYLLANNLTKPEQDKQYQLWAIVDGKPVDAGVFDVNDVAAVIKLKNIPSAQAFAVTLEKRGGSVTPTMPIYVLGKVNG